MRFRSFRAQLLALILTLTGGAQLVAFLLVARLHRTDALREIDHQLTEASKRFLKNVDQRNTDLAGRSEALSFDTGLRETLATTTTDRDTLATVMGNVRDRVGASLAALLSLEGKLLAETRDGPSAENIYRPLQVQADAAESARATSYGFIDGTLYSVTMVPLRAPDIVAWIAIGFPLDRAFLDELHDSTGVESLLRHGPAVLAATATPPGKLISRPQTLPTTGSEPATLELRYSLDEKLAPAHRLENVLLVVGAGSLFLAALIGAGFARRLTRPVQQLAEHTAVIARGDYATTITLDRTDELGRLADSFNRMSAGLAERDRVRDLLDKNVSPEVAAQLMRDGAALGGEEREVTILFADLRGFTTLSEQLPPRELLTLLNRYLDRMSAEIEQQGGIIDKYIGDAIMALFGAPVAQSDAPARALAAALAMQRALVAFNAELAAEGRAPLGIGIGINTARIVAGNIGSHRRLNYSVIGDGVNIAARIESLTRKPEYRTSIIATAATIAACRPAASPLTPHAFSTRPLGTVQVKGRAEPVEIFAVEA